MTILLGGDIHGELPEKTSVPLITKGEPGDSTGKTARRERARAHPNGVDYRHGARRLSENWPARASVGSPPTHGKRVRGWRR